jgi:hypothetical protein
MNKPNLCKALSFALLLFPTARIETLGAITVSERPYHQWTESAFLSNGKVEVVIVPAVGRVMQFRFAGQEEGPFWENRALDGKSPDPASKEWGNFGGDKSWPSPQGDWPRITGRGWPPPGAFDSMPVELKQEGDDVVLISKVDSHYGIRERRRISLAPSEAQMRIVTEYEKTEGPPVKTGVWVITQFQHPERVFIPVPAKTLFAQVTINNLKLCPKRSNGRAIGSHAAGALKKAARLVRTRALSSGGMRSLWS